LENRAKQSEIKRIISTDLLELLVLLCSIIMQQYTLQCTIYTQFCYSTPVSRTNITSQK